jgi:hypothetical protein
MPGMFIGRMILVAPQCGVALFPKMGMLGNMKLANYMATKHVTPEELARLMPGTSVSGIVKWMREERVPRPDQQRRIFEATAGEVTPNDFILTPSDAKSSAAA